MFDLSGVKVEMNDMLQCRREFYKMKEQIKAFLKNYKKEIMDTADQLRNRPMREETEELFALFETTGNRLQYEDVYFERRKYLATFGLACYLEHRPEDLKKMEEVLRGICAERCWALPAHVDRKQDPNWKHTVDLFASETAQCVSEIITFLENDLSEEIKNMVRQNVEERVFRPFYESEVPYKNWEHGKSNWNAVCAGSIGSASIYLMKDDPVRLEACLKRICAALQYFLGSFADDGACMEGLGYFTYGMTYFVGFADQLYQYTNGKIDLLESEKCKKMAEFQQKCYFSKGRTLSFSDGNSRDRFRMGLTAYLAMRFSNVSIPNMERAGGFHQDSCYRFMGNYRDIIWTEKYLEMLESGKMEDKNGVVEAGQVVLPMAQWSICNAENGNGCALKGGDNDEPHNHNDVGNFLFIKGEELLLTDLGAGEYTRQYFRAETRYKHFGNSSLGHCVPVINGKAQMPGKEFAADLFEGDGNGTAIVSFSGAYEKGAIASIVRKTFFDLKNGSLTVEDTFEPSENTVSIEERIISEYKPEIKGNEVIIKGEKECCRVLVENLEGEITYSVHDFSDHHGNHHDIYAISWNVPADATHTSRFVVG